MEVAAVPPRRMIAQAVERIVHLTRTAGHTGGGVPAVAGLASDRYRLVKLA